MAQIQENGFKTIRQTYGSQHFDITLDGTQTVNFEGQNIVGVKGLLRTYDGIFSGMGPQHPFDPTVPQEMYTFEGEKQFYAYDQGDEVTLYDHGVSSFDVNPFNAILGDELGNYVISVDEVWAYGAGQSLDSYNTISLIVGSTRNFPGTQSRATNPYTLFSWRNVNFSVSELGGIQVKADEEDIYIKVNNISPVGTPSDPNDNIVYIRFKLTARKVFNV